MPVLTVALTGGIAAGKSVIAQVLKQRGCFVESADLVARALLNPGRPAWRAVVARFGPAILRPDRTIDRPKLAGIVFANAAERRWLDAVVHPLVMAQKQKTVLGLKRTGRSRIYVSEAALTVEAGFLGFFDRVVVADCPRRLQVERLMARSGLSRADAGRRVRAQLPRRRRLRVADYVIDTSGSLENTVAQAEVLAVRLKEDLRRLAVGSLPPGRMRKLRTGARRPAAGP